MTHAEYLNSAPAPQNDATAPAKMLIVLLLLPGNQRKQPTSLDGRYWEY